jgi:hypothetical protein
VQRGGLRARLVRVTTGDTLDLGQGHLMSFFLSGTPRWPEGTPPRPHHPPSNTLDLGQGHLMSFFLSGTPRWPEGTSPRPHHQIHRPCPHALG